MVKHAKMNGLDVDMARPVQDNVAPSRLKHKAVKAPRSALDMGLHPSSEMARGVAPMKPGKSVSADAQQATSLPGKLGFIDPHSATSNKDARREGIPGIIQTTTEGAATRQRMVGGIIESPLSSGGKAASGPVHAVQGVDATAYNAGMKHIPGSPFTSRR